MSAKKNRKSKHTPGLAPISKISNDPLSELRTLFTNIRTPSFNKFKEIIEQEYPILGGDIRISILYFKWPDFYPLENTLYSVISNYKKLPQKLAFLKSIRSQVKKVNTYINIAKESFPETKQSRYQKSKTLYYEESLKKVYKETKAFCAQLNQYYLPSIHPFEAWTDDLLKFFESPEPLDKLKKGFQLNSLIWRIRLKLLQIPKSIRLSFLYKFYIVETSAIILQDAA